MKHLLEMLRLHNKEDVDGMLHLLPLFSIRALWTGNCQEFITCNHTPEEQFNPFCAAEISVSGPF